MCNAQNITTKKNGGEKQASLFGVSTGVSISQERFIISGISATAGPIVNVSYHSFFNKRWGMGVGVSGGVYKSEAVNQYSYPSGYAYYSSYPKKNWQKTQTYISFSYTPILRKRWAIDIIQSFGLYYIKQPAYDYYNYGYYSVSTKKDWGTGYNISLRGRVLLKNNIGLFASANFFHALGIPINIRKYHYSVNAFDTLDWSLGIIVNLKK